MKRLISLSMCLLLTSALWATRLVETDVIFSPLDSQLLPSGYVKCVYQDEEGFIWIAANNGLVRYDGDNAVSYASSLDKYSFLYKMVEDVDGRLLLATDKGLVCMDKQTGRMEVCIDGCPLSTVVRDNAGNIWAGGEDGIFLRPVGQTEFSPVDIYFQDKRVQGIIDLLVTADGKVWMTTWRKGLYVYEPTSGVVRVFNKELLAYSYVLHEDSEGYVWTGTWGRGLLRLDRDFITTASYRTFPAFSTKGEPLLDEVIYAINDLDGNILVGGQKGFSILDVAAGTAHFYAPGPGEGTLPYNQVNSILVTSNDNVYLGLYGGGMCRVDYHEKPYKKETLRHIRKQFGTNTIHSICQADEKKLWLGLPDHAFGLYDPSSNSVQKYSEIPHFKNLHSISSVFAIRKRAGTAQVCFGTYSEGLWIYDYKTSQVGVISSETSPVMTNNSILSLENDPKGNLWIGTNAGAFILTPDDEIVSLQDVLPGSYADNVSDQINAITIGREGKMFLATTYNGILEVSLADSTLDVHTCKGKQVSFANVQVDASGNVWAGSLNEGLYFLDRTEGCMIQKNPAEGMRSRFVTNLVHLTGNVMLMTTSSEVLTFSYDDENGIAVNNYFTDQELDFSTNAHLVKEDSLLLGTTDGLLYFSLDDCCHQHCRNSSIAITDFIVNGKSYRENEDMELDINYMDEIKVRRGDNVEIKFTMLDDCASHSSVYSYSYGDVSGVTVAGSISFEVSQSRTVVQIGHDLSGESRKIVVSATYDSLVIYILIVAVAVSILLLILLWLSVRRSRRQKPDVIEFEINSIKFAAKDQDFVQKAMQIVNNHISDSEFKQEDFIREMGVSRTLLTGRLKELTGFTPVSLILEVRLKTAYTSIMESEGKIRVSEVAYSVGFNDAKYFSTCFRKKFGVSPKELISQRNNADMTKEEV